MTGASAMRARGATAPRPYFSLTCPGDALTFVPDT